jgi:divalent metal cation (Fe/Co/Zn/Cd) transporter
VPDPSAPTTTGPARTAVRLEYATIGWGGLESVGAIGAGLASASVALVAFGLDSAIEIVSATVVLLHLRALLRGDAPDEDRERRALRIIAVTFFALAAYVSIEAAIALVRSEGPDASPLGIAVTASSLVVMLALARAKRTTAGRLADAGHPASAALLSADAAESALCGALSLATLLGLLANAQLGWWWADPLAGLVVVYFAIREGLEAWEGELEYDAD